MSVSAQQVVQHYAQNQRQAQELVDRYQALSDSVDAALAQAGQELEGALTALATAYLPELTPPTLARAEKLTGFRGFSRRDPFQAMDREATVLRQSITRIEAEEQYHRREFIVGPVGELTRKLEEARSLLEPWETECARFEALEGFSELVQAGYDTPSFAERFWEPAYWQHWAAGDRICAALGMADFGDEVLPAFQKADLQRQEWRGQVAQVEGRIDAVHELVRQHDQALARIPRLPEVYLDGCRQALAAHLRHADVQLLDQWIGADTADPQPVQLGLRRLSGATAKLGYLGTLQRQGVQQALSAAQDRVNRYGHKIDKFQRPKYARSPLSEDLLDPDFGTKAPHLMERADTLARLAERLLRFDRYDSFDLANPDELWWLEMTGRQPSTLTPELYRWYRHHPNTKVRADPLSPSAATATAAAARDQADVDLLS